MGSHVQQAVHVPQGRSATDCTDGDEELELSLTSAISFGASKVVVSLPVSTTNRYWGDRLLLFQPD
jgi:hypothetical protein